MNKWLPLLILMLLTSSLQVFGQRTLEWSFGDPEIVCGENIQICYPMLVSINDDSQTPELGTSTIRIFYDAGYLENLSIENVANNYGLNGLSESNDVYGGVLGFAGGGGIYVQFDLIANESTPLDLGLAPVHVLDFCFTLDPTQSLPLCTSLIFDNNHCGWDEGIGEDDGYLVNDAGLVGTYYLDGNTSNVILADDEVTNFLWTEDPAFDCRIDALSDMVGMSVDADCVQDVCNVNPNIDLIKTGLYDENSAVVTYTYTATNTGDVTLFDLTVTESAGDFTGTGTLPVPVYAGGGSDEDGQADLQDLLPGASMTFTATYAATQTDINAGSLTNQATVSGVDPNGAPVTDLSDDNMAVDGNDDPTVTILGQNAAIGLVKTASFDPETEVVSYVYTVSNLGNTSLFDVVITENAGAFTGSGTLPAPVYDTGGSDEDGQGDIIDLLPGESLTYTASYPVTQSDINAGSITNQAAVNSEDPNGDPVTDLSDDNSPLPGNDDPTVTPIQLPRIIEWSFGDAQYDCGEQPTQICFPLQVAINDPSQMPELATSTIRIFYDAGSLNNLSIENIQNGYTVNGLSESADVYGDVFGFAGGGGRQVQLDLIANDVNPIDLATTAVQVLDFCFTVDASASFPLCAALVFDNNHCGWDNGIGEDDGYLANDAGMVGNYYLNGNTGDIILADDEVTNFLWDEDPSFDCRVEEVDDVAGMAATTGCLEDICNADVGLVKTAAYDEVTAMITYTYTVTNTGTTTIFDLAVTEDALTFTGSGTLPAPTYVSGGGDLDGQGDAADLSAGASMTFSAGYMVTQADFDQGSVSNQALVSGSDPAGNPITDLSDDDSPLAGNDDPTVTPVAPPRIIAWSFGDAQYDCGEQTTQICFPLEVAINDPSQMPELATSTIRIFYDAGSLNNLTIENIQNGYTINGLSESADVYGDVFGFAGGGGRQVQLDLIANDVNPIDLSTTAVQVLDFCFTVDAGANFPLCAALVFDNNHCGWDNGIGEDDGYLANDAGMVGNYYLNGNTSDIILADDEVTNFLWDEDPSFDCRVEEVDDVAGMAATTGCLEDICNADIGLVKTSSFDAGTNTLIYTYTVTNTGTTTIFDLAVTEEAIAFTGSGTLPTPTYVGGGADLDGQGDAADLSVGASMTFSANYLVTQADFDLGSVTNQALASGSDPAGNPITDLSDDDSPLAGNDDPTVTPVAPARILEWSFGDTQFECGEQTTQICFPLEVAINDPSQMPELATSTIRIFYDAGSLNNLTIENVQNGYSINGLSESADVYGDVFGFAGGGGRQVQLDLVANEANPIGLSTTAVQVLDFCFTVDASTSFPLCAALVFDNNHCGWDNGIGDDDGYLANDAGMVGNYFLNGNTNDIILADDEVTNFLWDEDPAFDCRVEEVDDIAGMALSEACIEQFCFPELALSKTATAINGDVGQSTYSAVGDVITYTFVATNAGNTPLTNVTISDPLPGLSALSCTQPVDLAPGESLTCTATYTITQTDLDNGSVDNTATADSDQTDPVTDNETVPAEQTPIFSLSKTADLTSYDAVGDVITYTFVATNDGNVSLTNVTISDPLPGLSALSCTQPVDLAPGESLTCTATYTITQTDLDNGSVDNTATTDSDQTDPVTDNETVPAEQTPILSLSKTADLTSYNTVGDVITYTFVATNDGNVELTNVTISDPLPGLSALSCTQPVDLAPGESLTCTATYMITQTDLDNGSVDNTATTDSDQTDPVTDDETVPAEQTPVLSLSKTADLTSYNAVGDVITYTFVATNDGNVGLTNVTISDPLPGLSALSCTQPIDLLPGESLTCTATYMITQTDLDNGSVDNTATADSDQTDPVTDDETVPADGTPLLSLSKTADLTSYNAVGDVITYTFVATNDGNVGLTNVTISDPLPGLSALSCTQPVDLAPGESLTCTATYTITQADLDNGSVNNTATADSDQTDPVTDDETVPADQTPVLSLSKTADLTSYDAVGDVITYTFVATNDGNVGLTNVTISDPLPGLSALSCTQPVDLAPGESLTCTATYMITQADLDNGSVDNTATTDSDQTDPVTDDETVPADQTLVLSLSKTADLTSYDAVGDVITYTFVATNDGNVGLTNVTISDPLPGLSTLSCTQPVSLAPGESLTCTATYMITQTDLDNGTVLNTATADSDETDPVTDDETVTAAQTPVLSLSKTADISIYDAVGDVITYTFVATNEGNVSLTNVTISDPLPGLSALSCTQPVSLAPGESLTCTATYTITQTDLDNGTVLNTATADSDETDPVTDDETVTAAQTPVLSLSKTADISIYDAVGDVITYTFVATNEGNVSLSNVTISDPLPGLSTLSCTQPVSLAPGESLTCTATYTITQTDLDNGTVLNTATADSDETEPVTDDETVTAAQTPVLSLSKTADISIYDAVGDVITYTFVATNEGNVSLSNVTISDPLPGLSTLSCTQPVSLAPGESLTCTATYTITQTDLDNGSVDNTATADSDQTDPVTDDETVPAEQTPVLSLSKTADLTSYDAVGDVITYTFVATNDGNVGLTNVTISDPLPGLSALSCTQPVDLAPGESLTCTATYTITQADLDAGRVDNTATADSDETDPVTDDETVPADGTPVMSLSKTADLTSYSAVGDVITYTFVATNDGNVGLTNVTISDPLPGLSALSCTQPVDLAPGESLTCTATYTITQADLDAGRVDNTATADSDETDPVTDDDTVTATQTPILSLSKTADISIYDAVGDVITYTFVATNEGNVSLTNVTISDPLPGLSALSCTQPVSLAPGESLTCTATYTISQTDLDNGSVDNTATADSDQTDPVTDDETVPAEQIPILNLIKTADVSIYDAVGDVITYTFVATNEGNVNLTNVMISDPLPGLSALSCTQPVNLAPRESLTCTATYMITQADLDNGSVDNTATTDSDQTDPVTDDETVPAEQTPVLSLSKTADLTSYDAVGDVITYTFVATNEGNVSLSNVTISDPLPGLSALSCTQPVSLAPGESLTCTATYTISQTDLDNGSVDNTATADSDQTDPVTDDETVPAEQTPVLSLTKTADLTSYSAVGDVITYTFVATNEGNVSLSNVTISDPLPGLSTLSCTQPVSLAPGESLTCTATYTITQTDLDNGSVDNTATADSDETDPVTDDETVPADGTPLLSLSKTADLTSYDAVGDVITYTFVATNDGNVGLTNVTISDPLPGLSALSCTQPVSLAPGESLTCTATYTISQTDLDNGSVDNTATTDSDQTDPVTDDETVPADQTPVLSLSKTADLTSYDAVGDVITYTFVATNDGNVSLTNVTISDPLPGLSALSCTQPVDLAPGESLTCTATYTITQTDLDNGSVDNTATTDSDQTDPVTDDETVPAEQTPILSLSKTADLTSYNTVGDLITYTFVATNDGNVELTNVTISDPLPGLSALSCTQPVDLAPGESLTCTATYMITQADLDNGSVDNTATTDSDQTDPVTDDETVPADQTPVLSLSKTADLTSYDAVGDVITYTFVATNDGNVSLTNVTISDPLPGLSALSCTQPVDLAPGESLTCTATYTITQTDLDNGTVLNTATADSDETEPVEDDEMVVAEGTPALSLSKTADVSSYDAVGDVITYTFVATNEGNVNLTNVMISDPLPGLSTLSCTQPVSLAPGESLTCTATYTITQTDLDNGTVLNTATADSDETDPVTDDETATAAQTPVLSLSKTADISIYDAVGDVITYTFVATNEGNVSLTNVTISDPLPGLSTLSCTQPVSLAPGESLTCTATYTITQTDLDNGTVLNTATADSDETDPVTDDETVTAAQTPVLSLSKTADISIYDAVGDVITYTFVATNEGNVSLTNVTISDPLPGLSALSCTQPVSLAPGESLTCTATYTISQTDLDNGSVDNTATADSDQTDPVTDDETVPAEQIPILNLIKTADVSIYDAVGDVITYTFVATNEGNVNLTNVMISDPLPGLSALSCTQPVNLAPRESLTCTATYMITQADLDNGSVDNTATTDSDQTDPVTDDETVPAEQTPVLSLTKTADLTSYSAVGDVITYTFVATNDGNVGLTNVTISDPLPGLSALSCTQPVDLAPGESLTCTATYMITQADLDNGSVDNTATTDSDQTDPVTDDETVPAEQTPVLSLTKTADLTSYSAVGDVITYTFVATNDGNVGLTNVTISDLLPGLSALSCTQPVNLAPGESLTCTATYTITQADLDAGRVDNTATADSDETDPVTDDETVPADGTPVLSLTKTADLTSYSAVGDVITYTFVATNDGNVGLTNVTISDPLPGLSALSCTQPVDLAPGESLTCTATYTITQADLDAGRVDNTATADSDETDPVTDDETVPADGTPLLSLSKTADLTSYDAVGDVITYTFVATNDGNVGLTNVTISDPLPGLSALSCTQPVSLAPGESLTCTATYTITQTDLDNGTVLNTATADSDETDPVTDDETVTATQDPALSLAKTADVSSYDAVGNVITYTFVATNEGNVSLNNVTISDPLPGLSTLSCTQPVSLAPGESLTCTATYTITQTDLDNGTVLNTAAADSDETDPVTDDETVTATQTPILNLIKTADVSSYDAVGDVITYTFVATNEGNVNLTNVTISDPLPGLSALSCTQPVNLAPRESLTCTATYMITQADLDNGSVDNTATTDSDQTDPVTDDETVPAEQTPVLSLTKTADLTNYSAVGDVITYTFVATNEGNVSLSNVTISDPLPGLSALSCTQPVSLAPGESLTCTATYTITQTDLDNGSVDNTATADSDQTDPVTDDETVPAEQTPVLSLSKTADLTSYSAVGDVITYTFVATNDGNVGLTNVTISDPLPGLSALSCTQPVDLAPGESLTCTATYTITQADLDAGRVDNTATADSDQTDPVTDDETVLGRPMTDCDAELVCAGQLNVNLQGDCQAVLTAASAIPAYTCEVTIVVEDGFGADQVINGCGTYKYVVTAVNDPNNNCWGYITAEDKQAPVCVEDSFSSTVTGWSGTDYAYQDFLCDDVEQLLLSGPVTYTLDKDGQLIAGSISSAQAEWLFKEVTGYARFTDNCGNIHVTVSDVVTYSGDQDCDPLKITRTFTAVDECGEPSDAASCSQDIIIRKPALEEVYCPQDAEIDCEDTVKLDANGNPHPDETGYPWFYTAFDNKDLDGDDNSWEGKGITYLGQSSCNLGASYTDGERIVVCEGTYKFVRTWEIQDWCTGEWETCTQIIKVGDYEAPVVRCEEVDYDNDGKADLRTYSTGPYDCTAAFAVPMPLVEDNCSSWEVLTEIVGFGTNGPVVATILPGASRYVSGIPLGCHYIKYTVTDACGNKEIVYCPFKVEDLVEPVAVCDDDLNVSIGGQGLARVYADDIDEGSSDNCGPIRIEVRRRILDPAAYECLDMFDYDGDGEVIDDEVNLSVQFGDPEGDGNGEEFYYTPWLDYVDFTCCDMNENVRIELRVWDDRNQNGKPGDTIEGELCETFPSYDKNGYYWDEYGYGYYQGYEGEEFVPETRDNYNVCWMDLLIEDKLPSYCVPPLPVMIDCNELPFDFDPSNSEQMTELFGAASGTDNCPGYTVTELAPLDDGLNDCGYGTFLRRFEVADAKGQTSTNKCEQIVTIKEQHKYKIKFPKDAEASCGTPQVDTIETEELACDLLAVSVKDQIFSASGDECYKIFRTYSVINWCEYDGISDPVVVSRDEDCDGKPGDEDVWVIVMTMDDPDPCYDYYGDYQAKYYSHVWYDRDNDPFNLEPKAGTKGKNCDYETNPWGFWKEVYPITNNEPDPDKETDGYPAKGSSHCDDMASVGYWQYTQVIKVYDDVRPVVNFTAPEPFCSYSSDSDAGCPAEVSIDFQIEEECTWTNMTITVFLDAFADGVLDGDITDLLTGDYPNYNVSGTFPLGSHQLGISVEDGCGNQVGVNIPFEVVDCKAPSPICINGLAIELMPVIPAFDVDGDGDEDQAATAIWASDFIASPVTDCSGEVKYSINRLGEPNVEDQTGITLTCDDDASLLVEIWAYDGLGNADFCETYILLQDNMVHCENDEGLVTGMVITEETEAVEGVTMELSGNQFQNMVTKTDGHYGFEDLPTGFDYTVTPQNDANHLNGVSTFDLVLMSKHILSTQPLDSPYKRIAADINNDKRITAIDAIHLRRLILNIDLKFASNVSWRFIPADYVFPDPENPWAEEFPEVINVNDLQGALNEQDFIATKIGDVNLSARANALMANPRDVAGLFLLNVRDQDLNAGNEYQIDFRANQIPSIQGYQFTLNLDKKRVQILDIAYGIATAANFGMRFLDDGMIVTSWNKPGDGQETYGPEDILFSLIVQPKTDVTLSEVLAVGNRIAAAEAYDQQGDLLDVGIDFNSGLVARASFELHQNAPNPFRDRTTIGFYLPEASNGTLSVHDANGRIVKTIRADFARGLNQLVLQGSELSGPGVYFYTLTTDGYTATRKLTFME